MMGITATTIPVLAGVHDMNIVLACVIGVAAAVAAVESGLEAIDHRTLTMANYTGPAERRRVFERELL